MLEYVFFNSELGELVDAIIEAVESPDDRSLCSVARTRTDPPRNRCS
jgi:hypothetical protein